MDLMAAYVQPDKGDELAIQSKRGTNLIREGQVFQLEGLGLCWHIGDINQYFNFNGEYNI